MSVLTAASIEINVPAVGAVPSKCCAVSMLLLFHLNAVAIPS
jgi:hypothetical protein